MAPIHVWPAQIVRAPTGSVLYFRIAVPNAVASLVSLLPSGILPLIPVANTTGPGGNAYVFRMVQLQSETDPGTAQVRYTADGQTVPSATLGFVVPGQPAMVTIPADPRDISLFATAITNVQCSLIITDTSVGGS